MNFFSPPLLLWLLGVVSGGLSCCCCHCLGFLVYWGGFIFYILNSFSYLLLPELVSPRDTLLEAERGQKENSFMWFKRAFIPVCQSLSGSQLCPEGEELPLGLFCFQQEKQSLAIPFPHQIDFQFIRHQLSVDRSISPAVHRTLGLKIPFFNCWCSTIYLKYKFILKVVGIQILSGN